MSVDIINVSCSHLKMISVHTYNTVNNVDTRPVLTDLEYLPSTKEGKAFLANLTTQAGLLVDKLSLSSLFPKTLNIRPFKEDPHIVAPELTPASLAELNTKYSTMIGVEESDVVNGRTVFSKECVANFLTFCRVFGFYELNIEDVSLSVNDGVMLISVVDTNPTFTGYLEVLV